MANSESKNTQKGRFWNFLFCKKKKNFSPKRIHCGCCETYQGTKVDKIVQTNTLIDSEEEKLPKLNCNMYGNPKDTQKNGDCLGQICPLERRGCGFHLYFCIDNMRKSDLARNKNIKKLKYEKSNAVDSFQELEVNKRPISSGNESNSWTKSNVVDSIQELEVNKKAIPGENEGNSLAQTVNINSPKYTRTTTRKAAGKESSSSDTTGVVTETVKTHRNQEETTEKKGNSILRAKKTSSNSSLVVHGGPLGKTPMVVRISSTEKPSFPHETKSVSGLKNPTDSKSYAGNNLEEDSIFKEYEVKRKSKRKSMRSRAESTFVRNSLISIRKDRRSSIDPIVPQILSKLCDIEEKIMELEKVCEDRGNNITNIVGISCNKAKSTLSVDIKSQDSKDELNQPSPSKQNMTVVIKSRGENIVVNAPENVTVKKTRSGLGSSQLVYHNTQELDAHSIASNSFRKTRAIESQSANGDAEATPTKNQHSHKWRRISEELKI